MDTNKVQPEGAANRSLSLGALVKEKRAERSTLAANTDHQSANTPLNNEDSGSDAASEEYPSERRVIMMHDDCGNAVPMPMAKFYYDSVKVPAADADSPVKSNPSGSVQSNVPAPATVGQSSRGDESPAENSAIELKKPDGNIIVDDDEQYDESEEEEAGNEEDPFKNQFMRIEIPAARLKDVSRVKKDSDHDKPIKRKTIGAGLVRAISTVKLGDTNRTNRPTAGPSANPSARQRAGVGQLGRILSLSRDKSAKVSNERVLSTSEGTAPVFLERTRESEPAKPAKRQGLAAVGRMMSLSKQKGPGLSNTPVARGVDSHASSTETSSCSHIGADRPRASTASSNTLPSKSNARASLSQVGRLLSRSKKKPVTVEQPEQVGKEVPVPSMDRERPKNEKPSHGGTRMGLAKIGRAFSFKRSNPPTPVLSGSKDQKDTQTTQISPLSTSTISTADLDSPTAEQEVSTHDRERSHSSRGANSKKSSSRMKVKAAGRMLSFSRMVGAESRGRSLLGRDVQEALEKPGRSQSVPPHAADEDGKKKKSPKEEGRGDKFTYSEVCSERVLHSGVLGSETHIRIPLITLEAYSGPVSKSKWYKDCFTLPHNAVRRECADLYNILMCMSRYAKERDISEDDLNGLEKWWKTGFAFFNCYFQMEKDVVFPWVDSAVTQNWEVQMVLKKMRNMQEKLQEQARKVDRIWDEKTFKTEGELFALVYLAVDEFVPRLMNYFADQEVLLPAIVKDFYKLDDRLKMDKDMVACFLGATSSRKNIECAHHNIILLIRWMSNPRQLRDWILKNLNNAARGAYSTWYDLFEEEHLKIMRLLCDRCRTSGIEG